MKVRKVNGNQKIQQIRKKTENENKSDRKKEILIFLPLYRIRHDYFSSSLYCRNKIGTNSEQKQRKS